MRLLWNLFTSFFKLGLFTFGGGMAMLPLIRDLTVEKKGWLTDDEMVDCFAVCQSLPGVIAINVATYVGKKKGGIKGAVAASLGVILPSFLVIITVTLFFKSSNENPYIQGAFQGIKAASAGLILFAGYKLGKQVIKNKFGGFISLVSFLLVVAFGVTALWAIVFGGISGYLAYGYQVHKKKKGGEVE